MSPKYALLISYNDHTDISLSKLVLFYLNNALNVCPLTPQIIPCYTHKMAIASWPLIMWRHFTLDEYTITQ